MSRIAVVTGADQGLGFALAQGLGQRLAPGDIVYLSGRSADRLRDAAAQITAVAGFADELRQRHGGVDIVFSNAAVRLIPDTPSALGASFVVG